MASLPNRREIAWDCATGSGQAARGLVEHFAKIVATDASESQIANAVPHPRIEYRVATAYESGLEDSSVDLVTVAQAMHWFDPDRFYTEASRVLKPAGAIAIWGYADAVIDSEPVNTIVHAYNRGTIENFWMPERQLLLDEYRALPFPFAEIEAPRFSLREEWTLEELAGYLRSWSGTAAYAAHIGRDPVVDVEGDLALHWGNEKERHVVTWPLFIRAGYRF